MPAFYRPTSFLNTQECVIQWQTRLHAHLLPAPRILNHERLLSDRFKETTAWNSQIQIKTTQKQQEAAKGIDVNVTEISQAQELVR